MATCDRSGNKDLSVARKGRIGKKDIENVLDGKLDKAEVLCSDSHRSYTAFAKDIEVEHKKFNASKGQRKTEKIYPVQNANNMDKLPSGRSIRYDPILIHTSGGRPSIFWVVGSLSLNLRPEGGNANNMDKRLREFMPSFNGVATKYLQNYLNCFLVLEKTKNNTKRMATVTTIALTSNTAWFAYKQQLFNIFLELSLN